MPTNRIAPYLHDEDAERAVQHSQQPGAYLPFTCGSATPAEVRMLSRMLDDMAERGAEMSVAAFCVGVLVGAGLAAIAAVLVG